LTYPLRLANGIGMHCQAPAAIRDEMACASFAADPWHVLQTNPNVEPRVLDGVLSAGFRAYFPQRLVRRRRYGRVEEVICALFPTYLLVAFNAATAPWGALLRLRDAKRFLGPQGAPAALREGEVERLMAMGRESDGVFDDAAPPFERGQQLRVMGGPFAAVPAICEWSTADRVGLLMSMFGRTFPVEMGRADVEKF